MRVRRPSCFKISLYRLLQPPSSATGPEPPAARSALPSLKGFPQESLRLAGCCVRRCPPNTPYSLWRSRILKSCLRMRAQRSPSGSGRSSAKSAAGADELEQRAPLPRQAILNVLPRTPKGYGPYGCHNPDMKMPQFKSFAPTPPSPTTLFAVYIRYTKRREWLGRGVWGQMI